MNSRVPVSVIVVVKNGERYLRQALQSILDQSAAPAEIIVVDGQSEDTSAAVARSIPGVHVLEQEGTGLAGARNQGIRAAREEFVAFLDADDLWLPNKLRCQIFEMQSRRELQYTTTLFEFFIDEVVEPWRVRWPELEPIDAATPSTLVARRDLLQEPALFDVQYRIACDADWFVRARDRGAATAVVPRVLTRKRLHSQNNSRKWRVNQTEMLRVLRASIARQHSSSQNSGVG